MNPDERNYWVALGWHVAVGAFVIYLGATGAMPITDSLLALATVAGLALPSTVGGKPTAPIPNPNQAGGQHG